MKPGDLVTRKWRPNYGAGTIIHVLGDTIVVKWVLNEKPKVIIENRKYLKHLSEKLS